MFWSETEIKNLFLNNIPLIDVRAPIEFKEGHFPTSVNLPLLNDEERKNVGTTYKKQGKEAAIKLGHELISGDVKSSRIRAWTEFLQKNKNAELYCFRGGLRSQIATDWLKEAGFSLHKITGGYKALRQYLINQIDELTPKFNFTIIAGRTGSGKTPFLYETGLPMIDLEKLANHQGSAFGRMGEQPTQINFENCLAVEMLRVFETSNKILLEDESRRIGDNQLPLIFFEKKQISELVLIEESLEERIETIYKDYIEVKSPEYLAQSLQRISKKLGGKNYLEISQKMVKGNHRDWIKDLLVLYYDPLYDFKLKDKEANIIFRGNRENCLNFLKQRS